MRPLAEGAEVPVPEYIDSRDTLHSGRRRRPLVVLAVVVFIGLILGRIALSNWVDLLWFQSLGFGGVFWKTLWLETGVFAVASVVTFLLLYGAFFAIRQSHEADLPSSQALVIGGQRVNLPIAPALRYISLGVSIVVAR